LRGVYALIGKCKMSIVDERHQSQENDEKCGGVPEEPIPRRPYVNLLIRDRAMRLSVYMAVV